MSVTIIYSHDDEASGRWTGEGRPLTHQEVLEAGAEAGPRLAAVLRRFIRDLGSG